MFCGIDSLTNPPQTTKRNKVAAGSTIVRVMITRRVIEGSLFEVDSAIIDQALRVKKISL